MVYVYVTIFGALGAMCRYGISLLFFSGAFPIGTMIINITGCFLLAFVINGLSRTRKIPGDLITGIGSGFVGAFTTFSAFSLENIIMITEGEFLKAFIYIFLTLLLGIAFVIFGTTLGKKFFSVRKENVDD